MGHELILVTHYLLRLAYNKIFCPATTEIDLYKVQHRVDWWLVSHFKSPHPDNNRRCDFLGKEAINSNAVPIVGTARVLIFLSVRE